MSLLAWLVLPIVALLTATLSALIGMGGGIVLLGVVLLFFAPAPANALHGAVQLVSNTTRWIAFFPHIAWRMVLAFAGGAACGIVLCGLVLLAVYEPANRPILMTGIGLFILGATYAPRPRRPSSAANAAAGVEPPPPARTPAWFPLIGLLVGFLGPIVGATGPFTAPFFLRAGLVKESLIATKAACQSIGHAGKLILFFVVGRTLLAELPPGTLGLLALLALAVIGGTLLGRRLVRRLSPRLFVVLFRTVVTVIALKILFWDGLRAWLGGSV